MFFFTRFFYNVFNTQRDFNRRLKTADCEAAEYIGIVGLRGRWNAEEGTRTPTSTCSHGPQPCVSTKFHHFGIVSVKVFYAE